MCYIASAYKLKDEVGDRVIQRVGDKLEDKQESNDDGSAMVCHFDEKIESIREMEISPDDLELGLRASKGVHYHFRKATEGEVSPKNIHFWEKGNWLLAHNGTARLPTEENEESEEDKRSDSLLLFEKLWESGILDNDKIYSSQLIEFLDEIQIWGRIVLLNKETNNTYYIGDWSAYVLDDELLVLSSSSLNLVSSETKIWGLEFEGQDFEMDIKYRKVEGILVVNDRYDQVRWLKKGKVKGLSWGYSGGYSHGGGHPYNQGKSSEIPDDKGWDNDDGEDVDCLTDREWKEWTDGYGGQSENDDYPVEEGQTRDNEIKRLDL